MNQRVPWQLAGVAAVLLAGAGATRAAVQGHERVYWLGTGDWQLCVKDGAVCLVQCHWDRRDWFPKDRAYRWYVSVPTIKDEKGRFLASDPAGRKPSVHLVRKKGTNARWVIVLVSHLQPGASREEPRFREGPTGFQFRVKMAEGPFKDWYLAAGEPAAGPKKSKGDEAARRPLKLVRHMNEATVFTYIEDNYFVDHK